MLLLRLNNAGRTAEEPKSYPLELKALNEELMAPLITIKAALCRAIDSRETHRGSAKSAGEADREISPSNTVALTSSTQRGNFQEQVA